MMIPLALALVALLLTVMFRYAAEQRLVQRVINPPTRVAPGGSTAMPSNPKIESEWGIRFTTVVLLADSGLVEMRYQVLDASKAGRLHSGGTENLPVIHVEGSNKVVSSQSLMFHFHHGANSTEGRTYSILYSNADGAIPVRGLVTIEMPGGTRLEHIPVVN